MLLPGAAKSTLAMTAVKTKVVSFGIKHTTATDTAFAVKLALEYFL
jgi:hypothetical protein